MAIGSYVADPGDTGYQKDTGIPDVSIFVISNRDVSIFVISNRDVSIFVISNRDVSIFVISNRDVSIFVISNRDVSIFVICKRKKSETYEIYSKTTDIIVLVQCYRRQSRLEPSLR